MTRFWLILLNIFFIQGIYSRSLDRQKRVVNGQPASPGEFPYQVSIQPVEGNNYHHCGGTIISAFFVLTAAHCVKGLEPELFKIVSGVLDLNKPDFSSKVVDIIVYDGYTRTKEWQNDIALIRVEDPFRFDDYTAPAILPMREMNVVPNSVAYLSGFGRQSSTSSYTSQKLLKSPVTIQDLDLCKKKYEKKAGMELTDNYICVYDNKPLRGMCAGDSGGPLTMDGILIGVASLADRKCVNKDFPTIYINVYKYINWILKHLQCTDYLSIERAKDY